MALYKDLITLNNEIYDKESIKNAIKNILATKKGSLPGKPTFGCDLDQFLFNNIDHTTLSLIRTVIGEALYEFEPRIKVQSIEIEAQPEFYRISVNIYFTYTFIKNTEIDVATILINY